MSWALNYLKSSLGQKLLMSLTGLFLCTFLIVHLVGNLQLLINDGGVAFNEYSIFMSKFLPIKAVSFLLYGGLLLHAFVGISSYIDNKKARGGQKYAVKSSTGTNLASRNMALLGTLILAFLIMHMSQFWFNSKFGPLKESHQYFAYAKELFSNPLWVALYVLGQIVLFAHLAHGFQSAFQTLGVNQKKFSPIIKGLGLGFSILFPLGFALVAIGLHLDWNETGYFDFFKAIESLHWKIEAH